MAGPPKITSKGFIVLSDSARHGEFQKKRLHKSDPGKMVNLHIFKMAANETTNRVNIISSDENMFTRFRNPIFLLVANTFIGYKINHKQSVVHQWFHWRPF